jgi:hypothetical protein
MASIDDARQAYVAANSSSIPPQVLAQGNQGIDRYIAAQVQSNPSIAQSTPGLAPYAQALQQTGTIAPTVQLGNGPQNNTGAGPGPIGSNPSQPAPVSGTTDPLSSYNPATQIQSPDATSPSASTLLQQAAVPSLTTSGDGLTPNTNVTQTGVQTGVDNTATNTQQTQTGASDTTQTGANTSNLATSLTGLVNQQNTGSSNTAQTGTSSTSVSNPVTGALTSAIPGAETATNVGQSTLESAAQGDPQLQNQVNQAVSNSLSGPGMQGVGQAAQARAAGDAVQQVAQTDEANKIGAASALGGPTATTTLAGASAPYSSTSGTSSENTLANTLNNMVTNSSQNTNQTGSGTSTGTTLGQTISNLTGSSDQAGTAVGTSSGTSVGTTPQQTTSSGGCFVSSVLAAQGRLGKRSIRKAVRYKLYQRPSYMPIGYAMWGPALARLVEKYAGVRALVEPGVRLVLHEELRLAGSPLRRRLDAWSLHFIYQHGCSALGWIGSKFGRKFDCDPAMKQFLAEHDLLFNALS